jgi:hypothetical protein
MRVRGRLGPKQHIPGERQTRWTRVQTHLAQPDDGGDKVDGSVEIHRQLVVTGGDPPEVLEPAKRVFDEMPLAIAQLAETELLLSIARVGDVGSGAACFELAPKPGATISLAAQYFVGRLCFLDQHGAGWSVMRSPPVSRKLRRRPLASPIAWTFVFLPPRERLTA